MLRKQIFETRALCTGDAQNYTIMTTLWDEDKQPEGCRGG